MKLITWNCQGAFRRKADIILLHQPDILVIQECEHPDKLFSNLSFPNQSNFLWFGENKHKGLGIFSFNNYKLQPLDGYNANLKIVVPIKVSSCDIDVYLLAIWANNRTDPDGQYVEQVWKAVHHYESLFFNENIILTGDFNSNSIWDKEHKLGSH